VKTDRISALKFSTLEMAFVCVSYPYKWH